MSGKNSFAIVAAFLAGGVIGAGVALLYAPAKGEDTRKRLKEGFKEGVDMAKDRVDAGVGKVRELVAEKTDDVKAAFGAGKEAFLKGRERLTKEM